jgi:site-specific recombinase XerD
MHDVLKNMRTDLELRGLRENTVVTYLRCAADFLRHVAKPPDELTRDDVRDYLLGLKRRGIAPPSRNLCLTAIRFLALTTLQRPELTVGLRRAKVRCKVPSVFSGGEVKELLGTIRSPKHRAMVATLYGAGLRVSEMCGLRIQDIDSQRMRLRITDGKTGERYARLTPALLETLRAYYREHRPHGPYLFPGRSPERPVTRVSVAMTLAKVGREIGLKKRVYPHALRHTFAVHLLDLGADLRTVQLLLGHRRITSTTHYLQLSETHLGRAPSPLDALGTEQANRLG